MKNSSLLEKIETELSINTKWEIHCVFTIEKRKTKRKIYVFPVYNFKCNELNLLKIKIKSTLKDNYLKTCELNT